MTWQPSVGSLVRVRGGYGIVEAAANGEDGTYYRVFRGERPDGTNATAYWSHEIEHAMSKTLREEIEEIGHRRTYSEKHFADDPNDSFRQFCTEDWDDLHTRTPGNAEDLSIAYSNAVFAVDHLRAAGEHLAKNARQISDGMNYGIALVVSAGQTVNSSLLLHLRRTVWYDNGTLTILRTALDVLAAGAVLIVGDAESQQSWLNGHRIRAERSMPMLHAVLKTRRTDVADPQSVFSWLSRFVHFQRPSVEANHSASPRRLRHDDAYAALAYVAWACAVMAEVATGYDDIAEWPARWPTPLPWDEPTESK